MRDKVVSIAHALHPYDGHHLDLSPSGTDLLRIISLGHHHWWLIDSNLLCVGTGKDTVHPEKSYSSMQEMYAWLRFG